MAGEERLVYPDYFVKDVKAAYPDWQELHSALDNRSPMVGRYLDDSAQHCISNADILKAERLSELQQRAALQAIGVDLYRTWVKIAYPENE